MRVIMVTVPIMDRFDGQLIPIGMDQTRGSPPYAVSVKVVVAWPDQARRVPLNETLSHR